MKHFLIFIFFTGILYNIQGQEPYIYTPAFQGATSSYSTYNKVVLAHTDSCYLSQNNHDFDLDFNLERINDSLQLLSIQTGNINPSTQISIDFIIKNKTAEKTIRIPIHTVAQTSHDFSFIVGSCVFPYKNKSKKWEIFEKMTTQESDFMLWMGDNLYLLFGEWNSQQKIFEKYLRYRSQKHLQAFMSSTVQFSTWDDHDFGPNNSDSSFENQHLTRKAFDMFWANFESPSKKGIYYQYTWSDCDFFVLDGRSFRVQDSVLYGKEQLGWLKEGIKNSRASFKFIIGGSQFLSETKAEDWSDIPFEKEDFISFLKDNHENNVVFISGDRHFSDLTLIEEDGFRLFEITASPLTSPPYPFPISKNPNRIKNSWVKKRNFVQIQYFYSSKSSHIKIDIKGKKKDFFTYQLIQK